MDRVLKNRSFSLSEQAATATTHNAIALRMCLCYCCYCYWYSISLGVSHCVLRSCCCCRRCCWCRCLSVFGPLSTLVVGSNWIEHTIPIHCVIYLVSSVCSTLNENWFVHFCCVFYYHLCLCFAGWTNFLCSIHCLRLAHGFSSSTEWDIFQLGSKFGVN